MNVAVLSYLPPPRFKPEAFLKNLRENPPVSPLALFGDHSWNTDWPITKIRDPESLLRNDYRERPFNVANLIFFTALKLAERLGFSHFIFVEADCRMQGNGWDQKIIDDVSIKPKRDGPIVAGTACLYNGMNDPVFIGYAARRNSGKHFPIAHFRKPGVSKCIFVNGAGALYSVEGVKSLFTPEELSNSAKLAAKIKPYDLELGFRIWEQFHWDAFTKVLHIDSIFSVGDNRTTTERERLAMLASGERVLIHPVKAR